MTIRSIRFVSPPRGFSLVELMVSIVIGLLALLFAVRLVTTSEKNQRTEVGGSDSMQNGMVALFSMSGDAAQSGFGLNDPLLTGCDTVFSDSSGYTLTAATRGTATVHPLAPVVIQSNGQNPDSVSFYSGTSMGGTGSVGVLSAYSGGPVVGIDSTAYGFAQNDVIVVAPDQAGGQCALAQLSSGPVNVSGSWQLQVAAGAGLRFNTGQLGVAYVGNAARVFDLGQASALSFHSWSVSDGYLQLSATDVSGSGAAPATVADNIVSIKAEYGFDTRVGTNFLPGSGMVVSQWSATMIDADGDGTVGGAGDYGRIAAVRLAVVARSKAADSPGSGGTCATTTAQPVVFAAASGGAAAVPLTLKVAVSGDAHDWTCYRYRVFETIVPLRNFAWRPS